MQGPCGCSLGPLAALGPDVWVVCLVGCSLCPPVRLVRIVQVLQEPSDPEARGDGAEVSGQREAAAHRVELPASPVTMSPGVHNDGEGDREDDNRLHQRRHAGLGIEHRLHSPSPLTWATRCLVTLAAQQRKGEEEALGYANYMRGIEL